MELRRYPSSHPFAQLQGSDNIIAFTTQRYNQQPLIIRCGLLIAAAYHHAMSPSGVSESGQVNGQGAVQAR